MRYFILLSVAVLCQSCAPTIRSFSAYPQKITARDSVRVNWNLRGTPTMLVSQRTDSTDLAPGQAAPHFMELTLVAKKKQKETRKVMQIKVVPDVSTEEIVFKTELHGDTLVAAGDKNEQDWGPIFHLGAITETTGRLLLVTHAGKTATLSAADPTSIAFQRLPVGGYWAFRSLLTAPERADHRTAPNRLRITATILHKTR